MSYEKIYGARESLTAKSETMKDATRKVFESKGYALHTDSFVEGTHADQIFQARDPLLKQQRVAVEVKASKFSFSSAEGVDTLRARFERWIKEPQERRFTQWFFIEEDGNTEFSKTIFDRHDATELNALAERIQQTGKEQGIKQTKAQLKEIIRFLKSIEVRIANVQGLLAAAAEYEKRSTLALSRYAEQKVLEIKRREDPLAVKATVNTNLVPMELPETCLVVRVTAGSPSEFFALNRGQDLPPFAWLGDSEILTWDVKEFEPMVSRIAAEAPRVRPFADIMWDIPNAGRRLLKESLRQHMRAMGFWSRDDRYFVPLVIGTMEARLTTPFGRSRQVSKLLSHREENEYNKKGDPNFAIHDALEAKIIDFEERFFVSLSPIRYPTKDGRTIIDDGQARIRILSAMPDFAHDRNSPQLGWVSFWYDFAFSSKAVQEKYGEAAARCFGISYGGLLSTEIGWSPQAPRRDTAQLEEF
jgi:hypothetical protein